MIRLSTGIMILGATIGAMHVAQGLVDIFSDSGPVTALWLFEVLLGSRVVGGMLVLAGLLACVPLLWPVSGNRWYALQQALLVFAALGALGAIIQGHYPNGHVPAPDPHWFILKDQAPQFVLCLMHLLVFLPGRRR